MCNGYQHSKDCGCLWGGRRGGKRNKLSILTKKSISKTKPSSSKKSYPIKCWWCQTNVYYHTEGFNDCVLLDKLGYPWQVHECWEQYKHEKKANTPQTFTVQQRSCVLKLFIDKLQSPPYEFSIASEMGTSVENLRNMYGDLYSLDNTHGIVLRDPKKVEQDEYQRVLEHKKILEKINQTQQQYFKIRNQPLQIVEIRRMRKSEGNSK